MPPKSRAEAAASRAARAAARSNRSPAAAPSPAARGDTPGGARTPLSRLAPQASGTVATPGSIASVVSPDDLAGFPPLGADAPGPVAGSVPAPGSSGGRASGAGARARKARRGRSSAAKGAKPRVERRLEPGEADSDASTIVQSLAPSPSAAPSSAAAPSMGAPGIGDQLESFQVERTVALSREAPSASAHVASATPAVSGLKARGSSQPHS